MIAGTELSRWLADPARHQQSQDSCTAFAVRLNSNPFLCALSDALAASDGSHDAVLAIARGAVRRVAAIEALVGEMIDEARANPYFRPALIPVSSEINQGLLLLDDPLLQLSCGVINLDALAAKKLDGAGERASITFSGVTTLLHVVRAGGAVFSMWEAPELHGGFNRADSGRIRPLGRRRLRDGDVLEVDGRRESFVIEEAESAIVHVQAAIRVGGAPVAVEYDSRSLTFVAGSSTDEAESRMQMMVSLLRIMDRRDAAPLFEDALRAPEFFLRWHVMREYLALDAEAALPSLRRMADADPHPDVRAAARETLAAFFEDEPCHA